ncbi:MAG: general secretion pathway protein GspL [Proteobacteria bacterium]|nr:general secretion pathway protein GspL [Pseudomonadota bacterium]
MSILIVTLPSPPRLAAQPPDAAVQPTAGEWAYLYSEDGRQLTRHGRAEPAQWPPISAQTQVVALVSPADVVWHRATLPKASGPKLRAALFGLLEDDLLDESAALHLAVQPEAKAGESAWVAALPKPWLTAQLAAMAAAGCPADRIVPLWTPDERPAGHVFRPAPQSDAAAAAPWLAWRDAQGPIAMPLDSDAARALVARVPPDMPVRWTADADSADAATHWLAQLPDLSAGATVAALSPGQQMLAAAAQPWNLRQFDLAGRPRRGGRLGQLWQRFAHEPGWRPVRWGLATLAVVQVVGLNLYAWQLNREAKAQRTAQIQLLQATFPQVRAIQDPVLQMQREVDMLRAAAGRPGPGDLETLLSAAQRAWPPGRPAASGLTFAPGQLTLTPPWPPAEVGAAQARLQAQGFDAQSGAAGVAISPWRPRPGSAPPPPPPQTAPVVAPTVQPQAALSDDAEAEETPGGANPAPRPAWQPPAPPPMQPLQPLRPTLPQQTQPPAHAPTGTVAQ